MQTDKFKAAYRKIGKGPAIVLVHGFPENGYLWHNIWTELATSGFTVIIMDLPGAGMSTFEGENISMEEMGDSIKAIMDNEGVDKAAIVGHSMGGYVAMAFAERYHSHVAGLSLVHSVASADNEEKKQTRQKAIELMRNGKKETFIRQMIPGLFAEVYKKERPQAIEQQIERGVALETKAMIAFYTAMMNRPDRTRILEEADFPVQFIIGEDDNVIKIEAAMKQATLPKTNFISVYADCGHMSMLEKPGNLVKDLVNFNKSLSQESGNFV